MRKDEKQRSSQSEEKINVKRFLRKRWVVPAIYLIAAAGVLSSVFFIQGKDESAAPQDNMEVTETPGGEFGQDAIEVTTASEVVKLPIEEENDYTVVGTFYDVDSSEEEQQEALVYYDHSYYPNKGIDYAHVEGESFNVVASLSGTVTKAEKDAILGYVVELNHDHGIVTHYHSLEKVEVEVGSTVKQGDVLGTAGRNIYNEEADVHVHFEIRQNNIPINPDEVFQQPIDLINDQSDDKEKEKDEEPAADEKDKNKDSEKNAEAEEGTKASDDKVKDKDKEKDEKEE